MVEIENSQRVIRNFRKDFIIFSQLLLPGCSRAGPSPSSEVLCEPVKGPLPTPDLPPPHLPSWRRHGGCSPRKGSRFMELPGRHFTLKRHNSGSSTVTLLKYPLVFPLVAASTKNRPKIRSWARLSIQTHCGGSQHEVRRFDRWERFP